MAVKYQEAPGNEVFCWAEAAVRHVFSKILKTMLAATSQFLCTSAVLCSGWKHELWNDCSQRSEFGHSPGVLELKPVNCILWGLFNAKLSFQMFLGSAAINWTLNFPFVFSGGGLNLPSVLTNVFHCLCIADRKWGLLGEVKILLLNHQEFSESSEIPSEHS